MGAPTPPLPPVGAGQEPEEPSGNVIAEGPPLHRTPSWWLDALKARMSARPEPPARRRCPYCGRHNRPGPDTCPGCGATPEEA